MDGNLIPWVFLQPGALARSVLLRAPRFYLSTKSTDFRLACGENTVLAWKMNESCFFLYPHQNKQDIPQSESLISLSQELLKYIIAR